MREPQQGVVMVPRLVALLAFYDEQPVDLRRLVASLPLAGVGAVVASDGAYAAFPNARASSGAESHDALREACDVAGIALHLHVPRDVWHGGEVEKRTHLFALGEAITTLDDWYLVVDSDEEILEAPADLPEQLATSPLDVGQVSFCEEPSLRHVAEVHRPLRMFFRAVRGLHVAENHFTYATPDGRYLWGQGHAHNIEPAETLDVTVAHHYGDRDPERTAAKWAYYRTRDRLGLEDTLAGGRPRGVRRMGGDLIINGDPT